MKNLVTSLALAALLACAGCAQLQSAVTGVQTVYAKVQAYYADAPKTVYTLRGGYDIALGAAVAFKKAECQSVTGLNGKCAKIIPALRKANHQALDALDAAETFVRAHPTLDATSLIEAAQSAVEAFAKIETENGVASNE